MSRLRQGEAFGMPYRFSLRMRRGQGCNGFAGFHCTEYCIVAERAPERIAEQIVAITHILLISRFMQSWQTT
jgi:hypothetical protein